jgi:MFS family permease
MLGLFAGSDSVATTLVVGGFLFGLGVGSLAGAAVADRLSPRATLLLFAFCEAGIGICALLSPWVSYDLLATQMASRADALPVVIGLTMGALFVPTALMGMSLPLLCRAMAGGLARAPTRIGLLYGVNTLGGAFGCLVAGFVLIGILGYGDTVRLAAFLNLAVACVAAVLAFGRDGHRPPDVGAAQSRARSSGVLVRWAVLVFAAGFLTIALEIVWFRVLGALMRSDSHAFALVLGLFLLGDGIGVVLGALAVRRIADPLRLFLLLQGIITIYALVAMLALYGAHVWLGAADYLVQAPSFAESLRSAVLRFAGFTALAAAVVVPPGLALGMSFPLAQKAVQLEPTLIGWRVGMIQLSNILGNTAGAVLTGLLLLPLFGTAGVLRIAGAIGLVCLVLLLFVGALRPQPGARARPRQRPAVVGLALAAASLTVLFPTNNLFWARLHGTLFLPETIVSEGRAAVTVLEPTERGRSLYVGGAWQAAIDPFLDVQGAMGIIGPLVHPDPRSVLLIGSARAGPCMRVASPGERRTFAWSRSPNRSSARWRRSPSAPNSIHSPTCSPTAGSSA